MAAIASQSAALRASAPAPARAGARRAGKAVRLPSSRAPGSVALPRRRGDAAVTSAAAELAQVALDEETITIILAAVIGLGHKRAEALGVAARPVNLERAQCHL